MATVSGPNNNNNNHVVNNNGPAPAVNNPPAPAAPVVEELSTERKVALVALAILAIVGVIVPFIFLPPLAALLVCTITLAVASIVAFPISNYRPLVVVENGVLVRRQYHWITPLFWRAPRQTMIYPGPRVVHLPSQRPWLFPFYRPRPVIHHPRFDSSRISAPIRIGAPLRLPSSGRPSAAPFLAPSARPRRGGGTVRPNHHSQVGHHVRVGSRRSSRI